MSEFRAGHAVEEAKERDHHARSGTKIVPIAAAIAAVLAAFASLLAHHASTSALADKNEAVLAQTKAADQYNYYESKRIKVHLYQALLLQTTNVAAERRMTSIARKEDSEAKPILEEARSLEGDSAHFSERAEAHMKTYETEEIAATLFEVAIVLISISALLTTRALLYLAAALTAGGLVYLVVGLAHHP